MAIDSLRALGRRTFTTLGLFRETARNHPNWPHRHLVILGVAREYQRLGIGTALLDEFCRTADAAGLACYLETDSEDGRRLYERFGFRVVSRTTHGKLPFLYMWRQATAPGAGAKPDPPDSRAP
jgi:ribosomal protein S18 acetylase RimI-like enzyme